ncbi:aa3-type cytochrome oxidase subunit CtaJ [Rhodococcoides trifolii]|uniref:aa3-type cytochrome oxidase subunit CtaJ n=1 Tax=Rhodococcoides trifolii TaxID=908250 RepID=UPI00166D3F10|nr:hypothetical protein [Rhodococcus trifolii]
MSILETALLFGVIPVVAIIVIGAWNMARAKTNNPSPKPYRLGDTWDRDPILWSATDEITSSSHHSGHAELDAAPADLIGGTASGKW